MIPNNRDNEESVRHLISHCMEENRKKVLVIYDDSTLELLPVFRGQLRDSGKTVECVKLDTARQHGEEPPEYVQKNMLFNEAVICITKYSIAHTKARKQTEEKGITFLSMPDYNMEILKNPAFTVDYKSILPRVRRYAEFLSKGRQIEVTAKSGTHLFLSIEGRKGNCCPGLTNSQYLLGSPPDIEANVSPIEKLTYGVLVVDGSITDWRIGLLKEPVILYIESGVVKKIESEDQETAKTVMKIFSEAGGTKASTVGEFGIGFNDRAKICGNMLIDEGAGGCIHFGMGSNWTIGGENRVDFHLDFVVKEATVTVDGKEIIREGRLIYG